MPLPPPPINPGPGAYDLRDYEGPAKHYMSSSVFVSSSSRWHDMSSDRTIPGPGRCTYYFRHIVKFSVADRLTCD